MPVTPEAFAAEPAVVRFHPAPYSPLEKIPTHSTPKIPHTPWTEIAPTGSSMPRRSKKNTDSTTMIAAIPPMTAAAHG